MNISKQPLLEVSRIEVLEMVKKLQKERGLSICDVEFVLYQVLVDIKTEKEINYSEDIINLTVQVQKLEAEKKKAKQEQEKLIIDETKEEK